MRHSLKSVAKLAGVSTATVSLSLRGDSRVADKTRERVVTLAAELDYVPNNLGRALQAARSSLVGFLIPTMSHSYFNEILEGCGAYASERDYGVLVAMPSGELSEHSKALRMFQEKRVDGVILATHHPESFPEIQRMRSRGMPVVFASSGPGSEIAPLVKNDDMMTGRIAAEHLLNQNHSNIAYCYAANSGHERFSGALDACLDAGAICRRFESENELLAAFDGPNPPTAVIAYSDDMAIGVVEALRGMGLAVPEDVSIVGVDDSPVASLPAYDLTSVAPRKREIGRLALELVFKELAGDATKSHLLSPDLIIRSSTGPNL
ncbi:MAG: LacI family DNA-binding transcriptional regulator [Victivallales bacterium]|nr:LacI family DNA-binding transcriptional regulator [Victivallales bacterium]